MAIFRRWPPNGASNAGRVGKIRNLCQYVAPSRAVNDSTAEYNTLSCDGPWQVDHISRWLVTEFVDGERWHRSVYDKKPQRYAEHSRTAYIYMQWYIWGLSNNNKRLWSRYYTVETNCIYWRTQRIAQSLCNSRATCWKCADAVCPKLSKSVLAP